MNQGRFESFHVLIAFFVGRGDTRGKSGAIFAGMGGSLSWAGGRAGWPDN